MKVGDLILYTPHHQYYDTESDAREHNQVGLVLKLTPSGKKASVLWSGEPLPLYFAAGDLERYPKNFKLVSK
jgi:hypothetical protein